MISRKCDVCGEFYEIYNTKDDDQKTNGVMFLNIDEKGSFFSHKPIDLCENCMDKIRGFLTNIGEQKMVNEEILKRLFKAFPYAIINRSLEFVAEPNPKVNSYFSLSCVGTERQVQRKLLEWLSREASISLHYKNNAYNDKVHKYHRDGINSFLGTNFTHEDMELIYSRLGNSVNRELTIKFIQSGFDMKILADTK